MPNSQNIIKVGEYFINFDNITLVENIFEVTGPEEIGPVLVVHLVGGERIRLYGEAHRKFKLLLESA